MVGDVAEGVKDGGEAGLAALLVEAFGEGFEVDVDGVEEVGG